MRRLILIRLALCILVSSLLFSSGNAHAQTRADLAPRQIAIAADSGYTYSFYAGGWGWGFCLSHDATQGFADGSNYFRTVAWMYIVQKVGFTLAFRSFIAVEGIFWYLQYIVDKGRGVCIGFIWGSPAFPWAWSQ